MVEIQAFNMSSNTTSDAVQPPATTGLASGRDIGSGQVNRQSSHAQHATSEYSPVQHSGISQSLSTKKRKSTSFLEPNETKLEELLIAFALIFVPMASIALILLAITFYGDFRVSFRYQDVGVSELPISTYAPNDSYYTTVGVGRFLVVGKLDFAWNPFFR